MVGFDYKGGVEENNVLIMMVVGFDYLRCLVILNGDWYFFFENCTWYFSC